MVNPIILEPVARGKTLKEKILIHLIMLFILPGTIAKMLRESKERIK